MVNRFKGELAELLALKPCIELVQTLQDENRLPPDIQIHWGDMVQERRRSRKGSDRSGPFTKGADGLLMQKVTRESDLKDSLIIHGVVEVKSYRAGKKALDQINKHCSRLERGVKLGAIEYPPEAISSRESGPIRILIAPSSWKLDRELCQKDNVIVYHDPFGKPVETQFTEAETGLWKITLSWSKEALEQATTGREEGAQMMEVSASTRGLAEGREIHHSSGRIGHSEDVDVGRSVDNNPFSPVQRCGSVGVEVVHTPARASLSSRAFLFGETLLQSL